MLLLESLQSWAKHHANIRWPITVDKITCLAELCDIWEGMEDVGKRGKLLSAKSNVACIVLSSFWPSAVPSGLMFNPETLAQPALGSYLTYCKLLSFLSKWSQTRQRQFFPASIFLPLSHISEMGGNIPLLLHYPHPSFPSFLPISPSSSSFPLCLPFLLIPSLLPFQTPYIPAWLSTCDPSALASWVLGL